jgi:hypothetical protein
MRSSGFIILICVLCLRICNHPAKVQIDCSEFVMFLAVQLDKD